MKSFWIEKAECTGCGACANVCPKQAILMEQDEYGFIYPTIRESCIDCGMCESICKRRGIATPKHSVMPTTFAAWSKNETTRFMSTSGGIFSELVLPVLECGGSVAGARYNKDNLVEHVLIKRVDDLECIRQSKYTQSNPGLIYKEIRIALNEGKKVIFCGAPCQVAALYAFLGKDYEQLVTIDFICRGMNSPKAYLSWLNEIEQKEKRNICRVWFKYKQGGWNSSPKRTRIDFTDGHFLILEDTDNLFMHGYLSSNLYIRPSCGNCEFKGVPRQGDITLADFWKIDKSLDDDKGTSMVLINSEKGKRVFDKAKDSIEFYERDFKEILDGNICFHESVVVPLKSFEFLKALDDICFSQAIKIYTRIPLYDRFKRKIKKVIVRVFHIKNKI